MSSVRDKQTRAYAAQALMDTKARSDEQDFGTPVTFNTYVRCHLLGRLFSLFVLLKDTNKVLKSSSTAEGKKEPVNDCPSRPGVSA